MILTVFQDAHLGQASQNQPKLNRNATHALLEPLIDSECG